MRGRLTLDRRSIATPLDLRTDPDWSARIIPVDPEAHAKLREHHQQQQALKAEKKRKALEAKIALKKRRVATPQPAAQAAPQPIQTPQPTPTATMEKTEMQTNLKPLDEIREMFGDSVARAVGIQRPIKRGRRLGNVFTHEVLLHLYKQHRAPDAPEPLTLKDLCQKNGLLEVSQSTMHGLLGRINLNQVDMEPEASNDVVEPAAEPEEEDVVEDPPALVTVAAAAVPAGLNVVTLPAPTREPLPAEFTPLVNALGQIVGELNNIPGVKAKAAVTFEWELS